jgi:hypothetical protein
MWPRPRASLTTGSLWRPCRRMRAARPGVGGTARQALRIGVAGGGRRNARGQHVSRQRRRVLSRRRCGVCGAGSAGVRFELQLRRALREQGAALARVAVQLAQVSLDGALRHARVSAAPRACPAWQVRVRARAAPATSRPQARAAQTAARRSCRPWSRPAACSRPGSRPGPPRSA